MPPIISIRNLTVHLPGVARRLLDDVSMDLEQGKVTALIGASGSGKSLTSLAIMGLLPRDAQIDGAITFDDRNIIHNNADEWRSIRGNGIGMVFQEPMSALNPLMTVGDQIQEIVTTHQDISEAQAKALVIDWLGKVQIPDPTDAYHKYSHQMSGGQKQRVMIAMAMINNPKLLIADEPTTALDVLVQQEIVRLIRDLQMQYGTTVLFITHDLLLAQEIADEIIEMDAGRVINRTLRVQQIAFKDAQGVAADTLLRVEDVSIDYINNGRKTRAVDSVSFDLRKQEILGLVGGSGCGKTTLSKSILGLQKISEGKIWYEGDDIQDKSDSEWRRLRSEIQIIFQDPYAALNPRIRVGDAIAEPIWVHHSISKDDAKARVVELLRSVGLAADDYKKYPHEFSGGQRQRICIARALALKPKLIICDESVAALDIKVRDQVLALLMEIQQREQLSYIFITHDMSVVKKICDRVVVMEAGRIVEMGRARDVLTAPQDPYTVRLVEAAYLT